MHGCLFHWFSKLQKSVSLSSAEAEFFGAMLAAKETIFMRDLTQEIPHSIPKASEPTVIKSDSKSAVDLAFDPLAFKNTKHIMRAANFLRDLVRRDVVTLQHVKGSTMLADILTKACARPVYLSLLRMLDEYSSTGNAVYERTTGSVS